MIDLMFASRRGAAIMSIVTAVVASGAIMLTCGYYRGIALLPTQLVSIAVPIGLPLVVASLAAAQRQSIWLVTAIILAIGWVYMVYAETSLGINDGPSLAIIIGWFTSVLALFAALILTAITIFRR